MAGIRTQLATTYATEAIKFAAALTFGIISARALQPAGRGAVAAAWTAAGIGLMISNLGIAKALINRLNERESSLRAADYYGALLAMLPVLSIVGVLVMVFLMPSLPVGGWGWTFTILALAVPIQLIASFTHGVLRARRQILLLNATGVIGSVVRVLVLLAIWRLGWISVPTVLAIEAGYWLVLGLVPLWAVRDKVLQRPRFTRLRPAVFALVSYGVTFQAYSVLYGLQLRVNTPVLHKLAGDVATGYFAVGSRFAEYLGVLTAQVVFVVIPFLAQLPSQNSTRTYTLTLGRLAILALAPTSAVLFVVAPWIIPALYGRSFGPAVGPFQIMLVGMFAASIFQLLSTGPAAKGNLGPVVVCAGSGFVLDLVLLYLLTPIFREGGAAMASAGGYGLTLALYLAYLRVVEKVRIADALLPKWADVALLLKRRPRATPPDKNHVEPPV